MATYKVVFTPLSGVDEDSPFLMYLLQIDDFNILLDCGWEYSLKKDVFENNMKLFPKIDLVLISAPTISHIGSLPYLFKKCGLSCPIYTTIPIKQSGQLFLYDFYQSIYNSRDITEFTFDDIDETFNKITTIKYLQSIYLKGRGNGVSIVALNSGYTVGSCIWKINKNSEGDIIYALDINHRKQIHLNEAMIHGLIKPSLMIVDSLKFNSPIYSRKDLISKLSDNLFQTLDENGNILIFSDTAGSIIELLFIIGQLLTDTRYAFIDVAIVSHVAHHILNILLNNVEWLNSSLIMKIEKEPYTFLNIRNLYTCQSINELNVLKTVRIVITSNEALEYNLGRELLTLFSGQTKNTIIFSGYTSNVKLFNLKHFNECFLTKYFDKISIDENSFFRDNSGRLILTDFKFSQRVMLEGKELIDYNREEKDQIFISELFYENSPLINEKDSSKIINMSSKDKNIEDCIKIKDNDEFLINKFDPNEAENSLHEIDKQSLPNLEISKIEDSLNMEETAFYSFQNESDSLNYYNNLISLSDNNSKLVNNENINNTSEYSNNNYKDSLLEICSHEYVNQSDEKKNNLSNNNLLFIKEINNVNFGNYKKEEKIYINKNKKRKEAYKIASDGNDLIGASLSTQNSLKFPFTDKDWDVYGERIDYRDFVKKDIQVNVVYQSEITKSTHRHIKTDIAKIPSKIIPTTIDLIEVRSKIVHLNFDCRIDGVSMNKIIDLIKPRELIIVHGSKLDGNVSTSQKMCDSLYGNNEEDDTLPNKISNKKQMKKFNFISRIYVPNINESITIEDEKYIFNSELTDSEIEKINFYRVSHKDEIGRFCGILTTTGTNNDGNRKRFRLDLTDKSENEISLFVNNLQLNQLRLRLMNYGIDANFNNGVLECFNHTIRIFKETENRVSISAIASPEFFLIRKLIYDCFIVL